MRGNSIKTTLLVIFVCIILILIVNCMSKKSIEKNEQSETITKIENEPETIIADEITTEITDETETETETEIVDKTTTEQFEEILDDTVIEEVPEDENKIEPAFYLNDYERRIVECVVMGEAGAESYEGQILVAQCLLNGCIKEGVQPSVIRRKYKYSGWKDNPTDSVKNAVSAVFDDGYKITDEFILYFYAPKYSKGKFHETQRFVIELGSHRFFAEWN